MSEIKSILRARTYIRITNTPEESNDLNNAFRVHRAADQYRNRRISKILRIRLLTHDSYSLFKRGNENRGLILDRLTFLLVSLVLLVKP